MTRDRRPTRQRATAVAGLLDQIQVSTYQDLPAVVSRLSELAGGDRALATLLGVSRGLIYKVRNQKLNDSPTIRARLGINKRPSRDRISINTTDMTSAAKSIRRKLDQQQINQLIKELSNQ